MGFKTGAGAARPGGALTAGLALLACHAAAEPPRPEPQPEEPDYAFLAGGPYTQGAGVIQFIWSNRVGADAGRTASGRERAQTLSSVLRIEWGFTDRLEGDWVGGYGSDAVRVDGVPTEAGQGVTDTLLGVRYRLLREDESPVTLTMGPQVLVPTGDDREGFGAGAAGVAWDVSAAKDWGGPFFVYGACNARVTPGVDDPAAGSARDFTLRQFAYAAALGIRLLEEEGFPNGVQQDVHGFLEFAGAREDGLEAGAFGTVRRTAGPREGAVGIRYGIFTQDEKLLEVGVAFAMGLNGAAEDRAVLLQIQWEGPVSK